MNQELTVKKRVLAIRLADKIRRNPEYANQIGLKIENGGNNRVESQADKDMADKHEFSFI